MKYFAFFLSLLTTWLAYATDPAPAIDPADWPYYARDAEGTRYSPLTQITPDNVKTLERAWTAHTGDLVDHIRRGNYVFECTPLVIDGVMYVITPFARLLALEADTGKELWSFDPDYNQRRSGGLLASRGVAYWTDGAAERIMLPVRDGRLYSIDIGTHKPDPNFGAEGFVDLRELAGTNPMGLYLSQPPAVIGDVVVQGCQVPDGRPEIEDVPLYAFDVRTGTIAWTFNTVPQEGEFGNDTWEGDSWKNRAGVNVWAVMSMDIPRGILYAAVSTPNFDFYGGDRHGKNLFSDSLVALDAESGKRLWHYQTVHHDLWDYDLPAHPNLVDLTIDGETVPAVAQLGKTGFVYVFNRVTGEPIFPIEERPVPQTDVPGEETWPTQPIPAKPPAFTPQGLTEENLSRIDEETYEYLRKEFQKYRSDGMFTPPSERGSIVFPGFHGGANWSGGAVDPNTGWLFVNSTELACIVQLVPSSDGPWDYRHTGWLRFRDQNGYPANAPPWGQLHAIDLNEGEIVWSIPLGEFEELSKRGIPPTGQENFGGATVTASGLVIIASTMDERLRVFRAKTGDLLFETKLDAAGYAAPVTYAVDGKQYIAICAGGGGKLATPISDTVIAYTLPK